MREKGYEIDYINGPTNGPVSCRTYQKEIHKRIPWARLNRMEYIYSKNLLIAILTRFAYIFRIFFNTRKKTVKHITWFELSHLLFLPGMENCIVTAYDTILFERSGDFSPFAKFRAWVNSIAIRRAKKIITLSNYSACSINRLFGIPYGKMVVIPPGISERFVGLKPDKRRFNVASRKVILMVGTEDPRHNVDKIIRAVAILKNDFPGLIFLKAGVSWWKGAREKNIALVKRLGLENSVRFLGFVDNETLPLLYSSADVFVYPCSAAGWGLPPVEAMACGTPVIVSDQSSLPEAVGDCAIKINPEDPKEIAAAIKKVLENPSLSRRMKKCGIVHARQFTWENAAKKTDEIYRSLISGMEK